MTISERYGVPGGNRVSFFISDLTNDYIVYASKMEDALKIYNTHNSSRPYYIREMGDTE